MNSPSISNESVKTYYQTARAKGACAPEALSRAKWFAAKWAEARAALTLSDASAETIATN